MAELKTRKNDTSVTGFLDTVANATRRQDAQTLLRLMEELTGKPAKMWGSSIVGFDEYHYRYESGHEGHICMIGFSPRANALVLYTLPGFPGEDQLLAKLGKHKRGRGCLYINKLADIDMSVLESLVREAYAWMRKQHPATP
jgi:hypothetical protein